MPRILLAEDDMNFGRVLKNELEDDGYKVDLVADGVEAALSFIGSENAYDFVLLDIKMPKLNGINALRIIKKFNRSVPAITISGNAGSGELAESIKAGALRCMTKPFELSQLKEEIRKHITQRNVA